MSEELLRADRCCLLLVDLQQRLMPAIANREQVVENCAWLLELALACKVPVLVSEHCRDALGPTVERLATLAPADAVVHKTRFSCAGEPAIRERVATLGRDQMVIAGVEAHVCVLQSALGFAALGHHPYLVVDACGSRDPAAARLAAERARHAGVSTVNREMVFFEWLERAGDDRFRTLQRRFLRTGESVRAHGSARETA